MTTEPSKVAILFPADAKLQLATKIEESRFAGVADAFRQAGVAVVGAPYTDAFVDTVRTTLLGVDGVLTWFNPFEGGRDRTILNRMLSDIASHGVFVSAHPDAIDRMGTKEILYHSRDMSWGSDTRLYGNLTEMQAGLSASLESGARVLKQIRGQSGEGVWKAQLAEPRGVVHSSVPTQRRLHVRHAKRGSVEEPMTLGAFLELCQPYFASGGGMIDQPYQQRLPEGMIRCYVVGDRVEGFGEQLVNMLYPAPPGAPPSDAPLPGPRLYYPPTRPDFQRLKARLEQEWIGQTCQKVGLDKSRLPVIWDADFLYGPKDAEGNDTFVLCEINVSSVYPFPEHALSPLVARTIAGIKETR